MDPPPLLFCVMLSPCYRVPWRALMRIWVWTVAVEETVRGAQVFWSLAHVRRLGRLRECCRLSQSLTPILSRLDAWTKSWLALLGVVFFEQIKLKMCFFFKHTKLEVLSRSCCETTSRNDAIKRRLFTKWSYLSSTRLVDRIWLLVLLNQQGCRRRWASYLLFFGFSQHEFQEDLFLLFLFGWRSREAFSALLLYFSFSQHELQEELFLLFPFGWRSKCSWRRSSGTKWGLK
jgi:hypothetical protein